MEKLTLEDLKKQFPELSDKIDAAQAHLDAQDELSEEEAKSLSLCQVYDKARPILEIAASVLGAFSTTWDTVLKGLLAGLDVECPNGV